MKRIDRVWRKERKRQKTGWPRQIKQIQSVINDDITPVPAIQAVDLVAWLMNASHCGNPREQYESAWIRMLSQHVAFFDYDRIKECYPNG